MNTESMTRPQIVTELRNRGLVEGDSPRGPRNMTLNQLRAQLDEAINNEEQETMTTEITTEVPAIEVVPDPEPTVATAVAATTDETIVARFAELELAKAEWAALKAWEEAADDGTPEPATPNLDAMNERYSAGGKRPKATAAKKAARPMPELPAGFRAVQLRTDGWGEKVAEVVPGELAGVDGNWMVYNEANAQALFETIAAAGKGGAIFTKRILDFVAAGLYLEHPEVVDTRNTTHAKLLRTLRTLIAAEAITATLNAATDGTMSVELVVRHNTGDVTYPKLTQRDALAILAPRMPAEAAA